METAFDVCPFAVTSVRNNKPLPKPVTAIVILAMAIVICLFGGYVDSPDEQRISTAVRTIRQNVYPPSGSNEKEIMTMNPRRNAIVAWGFSTWFAFLSPVIGILLGLFGAFLFLR